MTDAPQETDALNAVTSAAKQLALAEKSQREAADALAKAMYDAHGHGHTWSAIAESAGLASPNTARTRARNALDPSEMSPSARWRREHGHAPRPDQPAPGVSVSEAARRAKVTRATIYAWVKSGKLHTTTDQAGRVRILLEEE